ncbi:MAG: MerR family DNA-binding protein [Nocardioidaceae bacterium]
MRIGKVAGTAGLPTQTIRFHERRGLLPEPPRGPNSYRDYDLSTLPRLRFIRSAQAAGLTLVEIAGILGLRREGAAPCAHVRSLLVARRHAVQERRGELAALEAELADLIDRSDRLDPADCSDAWICHIIGPDEP